jgi:hypothetical protein
MPTKWLMVVLISLQLATHATGRDLKRKSKKKIKYAYVPADYDQDDCQGDKKPYKGFGIFAYMSFSVITINVVANIINNVNNNNNNNDNNNNNINIANTNNNNHNNNTIGRRMRCRTPEFYSVFLNRLWIYLHFKKQNEFDNFVLKILR